METAIDRCDMDIEGPGDVADGFSFFKAQTARTCINGHLEERNVIDPAVSHLEMDDNVPGREQELGRPRHAMSALAL